MKANKKVFMKNDTQAQVGIGTLIIFIAMVLVAAVAAAVLIQTSGTLQQKAQATGEEAIEEVSSNIIIKSIEGNRTGITSADNITNLSILTSVSAGGDPIDFDELIITITDGTNSSTLVYTTDFTASAVRDEDSSFNDDVMNKGDLIEITLDGTDLTGLTLDPRTDVQIVLLPEAGTPVNIEFTTPTSYGVDKTISLTP